MSGRTRAPHQSFNRDDAVPLTPHRKKNGTVPSRHYPQPSNSGVTAPTRSGCSHAGVPGVNTVSRTFFAGPPAGVTTTSADDFTKWLIERPAPECRAQAPSDKSTSTAQATITLLSTNPCVQYVAGRLRNTCRAEVKFKPQSVRCHSDPAFQISSS